MDVTSTAVSNLHPNTTYFFAMVAMLSGFPSVLSDILSATTTLPSKDSLLVVDMFRGVFVCVYVCLCGACVHVYACVVCVHVCVCKCVCVCVCV